MKTYTIGIAGKNVKATIPERWDEVTMNQLMAIENATTSLDIFTALSGLDLTDASGRFEGQLYQAIAWAYSPPDWNAIKHPTHLVIEGKAYKIPRIQDETLGQAVMLTEAMANEKDMGKLAMRALAIYFQPKIDGGKFDYKRLPAIEEMIGRSQGLSAYAVARFFLTSPSNLRRIIEIGSPPFLHQTPQPSEMPMPNSEPLSSLTTSLKHTLPTPMTKSSTLNIASP